jgi:intracellular septation protein A
MAQILSFIRNVVAQLGTVILFWALFWTAGLKAAIAGSIAFILIDGARRLIRRTGFPPLYLLTSGLTIGFGAIDLYAKTPFMIKYEAVITNLVIAGALTLGARGEKAMFQELAEQQAKEAFPDRADIRLFFKLMTLVWAGYFVMRAGIFLWVGAVMPIERALVVRQIIGYASLAGMMLLSFQGERIFAWLGRLGVLPAGEPPAEPIEPGS